MCHCNLRRGTHWRVPTYALARTRSPLYIYIYLEVFVDREKGGYL
jgi:hypothetical protein